MNQKNVVVIGAGPAGLTAAWELLSSGVTNVTVVEMDSQVGGISRTVNYKGNRIDIGGHRFFSKSDWVMNWWLRMMPIDSNAVTDHRELRFQGKARLFPSGGVRSEGEPDAVMLVRNRLSRIYFNRRFFDYPLKLNLSSLRNLGLHKTLTFGLSYIAARLRPIKAEKSLEDFLTNRFGRRLYRQFFKEYTEKVWGVACNEISAEWGAQRIKSLSIGKALWHAARAALGLGQGVAQQTSLIESFIYPRLGPGQMWETVGARFQAAGGKLLMQHRVVGLDNVGGRVTGVAIKSPEGTVSRIECTHVVSTMPIKDLVAASPGFWSTEIEDIAKRLQYRDFITVGLLYRKEDLPVALADNWIYIQEPGVQVGRVQVFNNWSPHMVSDPAMVWLGLEFFCKETDDLWTLPDEALKQLAQAEMKEINLTSTAKAQDAVVIRVPKAYPGYFGEAYAQFDQLRTALDAVENLFLVGRNGMHRYNNQDHSMLTAKEAADQIVSGQVDKGRLWSINVDDEYHEETSTPRKGAGAPSPAGERTQGGLETQPAPL
ncbi:MAG: NAD(P)/FAD-dependent oxidoreductase [Variovorax sp.]|nr:NAD(P)/FAD-dependent oxidoreductase [Variovorax sp.]